MKWDDLTPEEQLEMTRDPDGDTAVDRARGHDERRWLRAVRTGAIAQMVEPWHLEGFVGNAGGGPKLIGAACSTTFSDPELVEWRGADDRPPLRERCPACQGAYARGEAVG